jgi:CMP-N-acetylneuraminic acid synthetase
MSDIPVIVPVKSISMRCPNKNHLLLPHTLDYLRAEGRDNVWVISDTDELLKIAKDYNFKTFLEVRTESQDELTSCWSFLQNNNFENFILCPVTHPFKSNGLMTEMEKLMLEYSDIIDFITTSNIMPDREQYFIEPTMGIEYKFKKALKNRKGEFSKPSEIIIDGSMYLIKRSFLENVVSSEDTNATFWGGRFSCVANQAPFLDIDTLEDLERFKYIYSQSKFF